MIKVIESPPNEESHGSDQRPVVTHWKGAAMIRVHSMRASVMELVEVSKSLDLVKVGIVGNQSTGKSETAKTIAHLFHILSVIPFVVKIFDDKALLNFKETLAALTPANYVLVFDDVSFLGANASKKQIEMIKQAITVIRHLPGGQDVKIVIIMNYHYTLGLDKYLRQSDFKYFTSVGSSEMDNMEKIVGTKYMRRVRDFQQMYTRMLVTKTFRFKLGTNGSLTYKYRGPFIPLLFYNNDTLRVVVSPLRQWIDDICPTCEMSSEFESEVDEATFLKDMEKQFSELVVKAVIKQELLLQGMNTYGKTYEHARKYLHQALEQKRMSLKKMATHYGIEPSKARLNKKPFENVTEA